MRWGICDNGTAMARSPQPRSGQSGKKPQGRGLGPTPLSALLGKSQRDAARRSGAGVTTDQWLDAVGPRIAARTRPGKLKARTLTVYVASPAWANELTFLSRDISGRLAACGVAVSNLVFRVGEIRASARATPTTRRMPQAPLSKLPASLLRRLEKIADPDLRRAVAEAAAWSLAAPRREAVRTKPGAPGPQSAAPRSARSGRNAAALRAARRGSGEGV